MDSHISVARVIRVSDPRTLVIIRRREFDDCLLVVGGLAVYIGSIDSDWVDKEACVDLDASSHLEIKQGELYRKVVAAAKASLSCESEHPTSTEVMKLVGRGQTDMTKLLSGAIVLNDIRDLVTTGSCGTFSRSVSQVISLATVQ